MTDASHRLPAFTIGRSGRVALVMLALGACAQPETEKPATEESFSEIRVETKTVLPTSFDDRVEATGSLQADRDATLSARSSGTLESMAKLGTRAKKGEVLARIDPRIPTTAVNQAEARREAARANLELAKQRYERQKPLHAEGVISALELQSIHAQYQQAQADVAQAEAALEQSRESLGNTRIVAPFPGVVDAHYVEVGEQVSMGMTVLRVVDASVLVVKAGLPERYAADIQQGAEVDVHFPTYGLEPHTGTVRFVATAIDPKSRTFEVEVEVANDGALKPEMLAKVLVTRARVEGALVVPEDAVIRDEAGPHVFVVVSEGERRVARRRGVTVKGRAANQVVIDGVASGDQVVTNGQTKLIDGDFVSVASPEEATAAASEGVNR